MKLVAALLLIAAPVAAGCDDGHGGAKPPPPIHQYVALGDSYTAGSGIGTPVTDAGAGCGQTASNYPRLVAKELGAELRDASCAGARTDNAFTNQTVNGAQVWPAQLNLVEHGTDLVTVSFGYNDLGFFVDALVGCVSAAAGSPLATGCADPGTPDTDTDPKLLATEIGDRLEAVVQQVQDRAPDAQVLVVGYPQPVPASGTCADLALADGGYAHARSQLGLLDDALRQAADDADATYVDVFGASKGHDICAGEQAWVNGGTEKPGVAVGFHPFQSEQDAVAKLVVAALHTS